MALKPTIYKFRLSITDTNRDYYDSLSLTLAQHPSETVERMMVRLLAFCHNAAPQLSFTKGLSTTDEPDLWQKSLDDRIQLWIDVGEPDAERVKKSCRIAEKVAIYSFNTKSEIWWKQNQAKLSLLDVSVFRFDFREIETLSSLVERTLDISIMLSGESIYISTDKGDCEVICYQLQPS